MTRRIHVHIDRLVLDGVPADGLDPGRLSAEVSSALEALLARDGIGEATAAVGPWSTVRGGDHAETDRPGWLGARIAHAVHDGLRDRADAGGSSHDVVPHADAAGAQEGSP